MIEEERIKNINQLLVQNKVVSVNQLVSIFSVSPMTIRRDLSKIIESDPNVKRCHGGAALIMDVKDEDSFSKKLELNIEGKQKIADRALEFIHDGDLIYLDAGTCVYELANKIISIGLNVSVVTNDLRTALLFQGSCISVIVIGGELEKDTGCVLGCYAMDFLNIVRPNIAFMGASAIDEDFNVMTPTIDKTFMKSKVISVSQQAYMLVDKNKFYKHSAFIIYSLRDFSGVITDRVFSEEEERLAQQLKIRLLRA